MLDEIANQPAASTRSWEGFVWPVWVPEKVRAEIRGFWREDWGRGPKAWIDDMRIQGAPEFGEETMLPNIRGIPVPLAVVGWYAAWTDKELVATGRYVHCWNNVGRLVDSEKRVYYPVWFPSEAAKLIAGGRQ